MIDGKFGDNGELIFELQLVDLAGEIERSDSII